MHKEGLVTYHETSLYIIRQDKEFAIIIIGL